VASLAGARRQQAGDLQPPRVGPRCKPEESKNLTYGRGVRAGLLPSEFGRLTLTADWWRIEQTGVVGIFTDSNHILLDYALRAQGQGSDRGCGAHAGGPPRARRCSSHGASLLPAISASSTDNYINLDRPHRAGLGFGLYYSLHDTPIGSFDFRANAAFLDKFFQGRIARWRCQSTRLRRRAISRRSASPGRAIR